SACPGRWSSGRIGTVPLRAGMLFTCTGSINVARRIDGQSSDFFFCRAVKYKSLTSRRDAIYQSAAVRAGNQVALGIESEHAHVSFVGLEEDCALAILLHAKNFAVISCGDVQAALRVELHVPDVFGFWIKKSLHCELRGCGRAPCLAGDSIYLAIWRRSRVNRAILTQRDGLHLQFLGLKNHARFAVRRYAIDSCGRARGGVNHAIFIRSNAPDKGRWTCVDGLECRS